MTISQFSINGTIFVPQIVMDTYGVLNNHFLCEVWNFLVHEQIGRVFFICLHANQLPIKTSPHSTKYIFLMVVD